MKKKIQLVVVFAGVSILGAQPSDESIPEYSAAMQSVYLYRNQAKVLRSVQVPLKKGENRFFIRGLTPRLKDSSILAKLPAAASARVLTLRVEKKALLQKRRKQLQELEKALETIRAEDAVLLDELRILTTQEDFLRSITLFQKETASKELKTRTPNIDIWRKTLLFTSASFRELNKNRRQIEKKREEIGKKIQELEFKLGQLGGSRYIRKYRRKNEALLQNRSQLQVQQFTNVNQTYITDNDISLSDDTLDTEKRVYVEIYSAKAMKIPFELSYRVSRTGWTMSYDIRASKKKNSILMSMYGSILQQSGEDWENVQLTLSTSAPKEFVQVPYISQWLLSEYRPRTKRPAAERSAKREYKKYKMRAKQDDFTTGAEEAGEVSTLTKIRSFGAEVDFALPSSQSIISSKLTQKKFIRDVTANRPETTKFYYELYPTAGRFAYLRADLINKTNTPWLAGKAQIFLENELMGSTDIPFTAVGKKSTFTLGNEKRLEAQKKLLRKFKDSKGVFSKKKRVRYEYEVTVESYLPKKETVFVFDRIPVSQNEKIEIEIENQNVPWMNDPETKGDYRYKQGIRKWQLQLVPNQKKKLRYDIVVTYPVDMKVRGL